MRTEEARPVRLEDYRPPDWLVDTVELDVSLDPTATRVRAALALKPGGDGAAPAPLVLDGDGLVLKSLALDGAALPAEQYVATADRLTIAQPPPRPFRLEIETRDRSVGQYPAARPLPLRPHLLHPMRGRGLSAHHLFPRPARRDGGLHHPHRGRQSRRAGAARQRQPDRVRRPARTGRHFAVWHDPFRKPSYLFALVGGNLACVEDRFRTMSGREVTLRIYVEPGKEPRCFHAMDSLKRAMRWDETAFGREYDLDIFMIVAVSDFNMGAMENKGLNVFNDKYVLASPETATDSDYERIEAIIAHEYFHNWTGNRITCRDWFQLCLKEGLTVFRDQEFTADQRSRAVERIGDVRGLRAHQFVEDAGPLAHPVRPELYHEINNFYTATVYEKGAEVVRMLQTLLGPGKFPQGHGPLLRRATTARRRPSSSSCSASPTHPAPTSASSCAGTRRPARPRWWPPAATTRAARTYRLELAQSVPPTPGQPSKEPMVIPLAVGLVGGDGRDLPLRLADGRRVERGVLTLTRPSEVFEFADIGEAPVPSLNRGFSAPIKLTANLAADDLRFLAARDPRSVQPLAGGADARHLAPGRQRGGAARAAARRARTRACSTRSPRSSPTARSSRPSWRWC